MATPELSPAAQAEILNIAQGLLGLRSLEMQNTGADYPALSIGAIKAALEAAYLAGTVDHHRH